MPVLSPDATYQQRVQNVVVDLSQGSKDPCPEGPADPRDDVHMPMALAAAKTDVEVLISSHPLLEQYIKELKEDKQVLQARVDSVETLLSTVRQENVANFQAAVSANDLNVLLGFEGSTHS